MMALEADQSGYTEQNLCLSVGGQVNNATARVMTNKKLVSPYANGEGLSALPYGKVHTHTHKYNMQEHAVYLMLDVLIYRLAEDQIRIKFSQ